MIHSPEYIGRYSLTVQKNRTYQVLSPSGKQCFEPPATQKGIKIYLIGKKDALSYVGITRQPMANRINSGLKADGKRGYHGYAWKKYPGQYKLDIWHFHQEQTEDLVRFAEAVEAEVAFLCRLDGDDWPIHQTEIHFSNNFKKAKPLPRDLARSILNQFGGN